jgi:aryl-alcohol dehydrogenase-like predicted oxidoreductase
MSSKIILGTAQFGLNYGISNSRGKIPKKEVFEILNWAKNNNIDILDTAPGYGKSETIIGDFISSQKLNFKIISKLPPTGIKDIERFLKTSLKNLKVKSLYGYLFHNFESYQKNPKKKD